MTKPRSAIIIGSGIGGLATAVFLAKDGYQVDIYEKNSSPGAGAASLSVMATGSILAQPCS
jgi:phytoene dehydrogenase-like protein